MTTSIKSLISYVSSYEERKNAQVKLEALQGQAKPCPPVLSMKEKVLKPLDTNKLIKSIILFVLEVFLVVFFILCCANVFGVLFTTFLAPVSIGLMIFVGIKIKSNDGITPYIKAKKENELIIRYNQKHAKEIKEAFEKYTVEKEQYTIAMAKYNEEVMHPIKNLENEIKKLEEYIQGFRQDFQKQMAWRNRSICDFELTEKQFFIEEHRLKELIDYYISK